IGSERRLTQMSSFSKSLTDPSPERRALLEIMLQEAGVNPSSNQVTQRIPRRKDMDSIPLSYTQQRLWFLDQLVPGNSFYNLPTNMRLTFPLDVPALERSLNEIVRRHEALRTRFVATNGTPAQLITPSLTIALPTLDLRSLPPAEREAAALRLASEE